MKTLTAKEVATQMGVSQRTAQRVISDIKETQDLKCKKITQHHLNSYLGLSDIKDNY